MSERRAKPYVSVSGIAEKQHFLVLETLGNSVFQKVGRRAIAGIQTSMKTQLLNAPNKYGSTWYPLGEELKNVRGEHDSNYDSFIHCYGGDFPVSPDTMLELIDVVMHPNRAGLYADGVQLNRMSFDGYGIEQTVDHISLRYPKLDIILQTHEHALTSHGRDVTKLARRIAQLGVTYVLLDHSHGKGVPMRIDDFVPMLDALGEYAPEVLPAICGGLSDKAIKETFPAILEQYPLVSWDSEGALRDTTPERRLSTAKMGSYLVRSLLVLEDAALKSK